MTNTTLYEIADMRDVLDTWLSESDGEVTPELEQLLADVEAQADEKIERVALYIREQKALAKGIKEEEERLAARRKARERAAESLTRYLEAQMQRLGKAKVNGLLVTVAMQKNAPSLVGDLDAEWLEALRATGSPFVRVVPEQVTLDRRALLDFAKSGGDLPEGLTVTQTESLRIR